VLEANSNLKQLFEDKREYKLEGCASFKVVHDDKNPFIIHTGDVLIKDIGTVFKVKYLPKNDTILVKVTEGLVQFYNSTSSGLTLKAGENGYYLKSSKQFFKTNSAADSSENRQNIVFNNITLEEVCAIIKKQFGKECYIENEAIKNCKINTTFTNATLQEVLDITTSTLGIWTVEKDNKLYFNGKACN
jgi:transmembrane sensor